MSSEKYGSLLIPVIISRMPSEISLQVARKTSEEVWNITAIMEVIEKEIEAQEISRVISVRERKPEKVTTHPTGTTRSFISKALRSKERH